MEQRKSTSEGQSSAPAAPTAPAWMHHTMRYAPDRRAKMLEHMARARSMPQLQAVKATVPTGASVWKILRGAYGCIVLFSIIALFFQSLVPFYIGAFLFLTDGERIESALGTIGIRFEAGAIGPKIIKGFVSLFGWFTLLVSLRDSFPTWLAAWRPPAEPAWSVLAGAALAFATIETIATRGLRHALPWFGLAPSDSLTWTMIKLVITIGVLALLVLVGPF